MKKRITLKAFRTVVGTFDKSGQNHTSFPVIFATDRITAIGTLMETVPKDETIGGYGVEQINMADTLHRAPVLFLDHDGNLMMEVYEDVK